MNDCNFSKFFWITVLMASKLSTSTHYTKKYVHRYTVSQKISHYLCSTTFVNDTVGYIYVNSFDNPPVIFFFLQLIQKYVFLFFTIYGVRHSSDGGLFFVSVLQNRQHAVQREQRPQENLSVRSLHPASAQDGWEGKRRKSNSEGSRRYYAETLPLAKLNRSHQQPLPTWHFSNNT